MSNMGPSARHPNGGRFVVNQYEALKARMPDADIEFFFLTLDKRGLLQRILRYPLFFLKFCVRYITSTKKVDLIHVHFFYPTILLAAVYKVLRNPNVKIVTTFHGSDIYCYDPPPILYRWCYKIVDLSIFVSEQLKQTFALPLGRHQVLSTGILDVFKPLPLEDKKYDVIAVGNLVDIKGVGRLEHLVRTTLGQYRILIVGSGNASERFRELASQCPHVEYQPNLAPETLCVALNRSKILLNLSRKESFGLVIAEANACGIPVLATLTDGSLAQIREGENGWFLENDDAYLATQLPGILSDKLAQVSQISIESCLSAPRKYRISHVVANLQDLYEALSGDSIKKQN